MASVPNLPDYKDAIIAALTTMIQAERQKQRQGNKTAPFKAAAYGKVVRAINELPYVREYKNVEGIKGIGEEIKKKIEEVLVTGKLGAAERAREAYPLDILEALQGVHGIGVAKASQLYDQGIRSIADLRAAVAANPGLLTDAQKAGLLHYENSLERIPREEMAQHEDLLLTAKHPEFDATIVGSYRRGAESSGDIDLLMTLPSEMPAAAQEALFQDFLSLLERSGYLIAKLSKGAHKYMGFAKFRGAKKKARRIDILLLPSNEYAFGILYFTGSKDFNVAMRIYAQKKGYSLSEHGLAPVRAGVPVVPPMKSEKDIFDFLGLEYVEPIQRKGAESLVLKV